MCTLTHSLLPHSCLVAEPKGEASNRDALSSPVCIYVAGGFRNDELFRIQNSSQEVGKNCWYISVCNSEAISPITLKHGHLVHLGMFVLLMLELSKKSFVWQSYGRKFAHDRGRRAKMSI